MERGRMKKQVLIIDDDRMIRKMFSFVLDEMGIEVWEAESGEKGLALLVKKQPDLILLDIMMPGLDGFEVCRRLKADSALCHIPVIALTVLSPKENRERMLGLGALDFIEKTAPVAELRGKIRAALNMNTSGAGDEG